MRRFIYALILVLAFLASTPAADTASKTIDRYKKAMGGDAVNKIKNTYLTGSLTTSDKVAGRYTMQTFQPDRLRIDLEIGEAKVSDCYNGKSAWRLDNRGLRTLLGSEMKRLRLDALITTSRLHELSRSRIFPQTVSKASVDGHEAIAIEFVKDETKIKLFFDAKSGLISKQERETANGTEEIFYSDYRPVDSVQEPFAIRIKNNAAELSIAVDKVEHNRIADEAAFRFPQKDDARPLPDVESLIKTVVAHQEKIGEIREQYTFRQTETQNKLDDKGRVKESEVRVSEVTPVAGVYVERLVSIDGKPLSAKDQEDEDRKVQKEVERALKNKEKRLKEKRDGQDRVNDDDPYEKRSVTILSILKLSDVTSMRREIFQGHEVIAFDFEPKKGVKPKSRIETIITKLAGTMWIDEEAQQIVRVEARLIDSFKLGGGLFAKVSPSTAVVLEQAKIGDEVWMPSYAEANFAARIMLFAKFNRSRTTKYSDYKKYSIENRYELNKAKNDKPTEKTTDNKP
jgi:hypothetical protein